LTFTAIVPDNLAAFESSFNAATLATIDASMALSQVTLTLPKFKIQGATFSVKDALKTLGATAVFDPKSADLSGIAIPPPPDQYLYISDVLHQAFISVDEKGTEAAAATGAMGMTATAVPDLPSVALVINQPFIFLIRDNATGAVVFLGRYVGG
jgi:serpin B